MQHLRLSSVINSIDLPVVMTHRVIDVLSPLLPRASSVDGVSMSSDSLELLAAELGCVACLSRVLSAGSITCPIMIDDNLPLGYVDVSFSEEVTICLERLNLVIKLI